MGHECEMFPDDEAWDAIYEAIEEGKRPPWPPMKLHLEAQDTSLPGWSALLQLVEDAANDQRTTFAPMKELGAGLWSQVVTLPPTIERLKHVKKLDLYRSNLLRLPPEIGAMESLEEFVPYTSYGLHWFPYEITRCPRLRASTVSTRALYGNYKYRQPFPSLEPVGVELVPARCSICDGRIDPRRVEQRWLSLGVATDVLPLLVNACSVSCLAKLPCPPEGYVQFAHKGGGGSSATPRRAMSRPTTRHPVRSPSIEGRPTSGFACCRPPQVKRGTTASGRRVLQAEGPQPLEAV